jgi:16S rRNA (guanine(966)-N(2))-methyltransferase RsmD
MPRIIAGRFRGRRLRTPTGSATRPTGDRMKESLYNVLGDRVAGTRVLDLYAGSGALGLEALSRGAARVVFVETAPAALVALDANATTLGVGAEVEVVRDDALRYLARVRAAAFDLVLADPPYALGVESALLERSGDVLVPGGMLVLQHHRRWQAPDGLAGWTRLRARRFGDTVIDFFAREESGDGRDATPDGALPGDL